MTAEHQRGEERERFGERVCVCVCVYARGCSESQSFEFGF